MRPTDSVSNSLLSPTALANAGCVLLGAVTSASVSPDTLELVCGGQRVLLRQERPGVIRVRACAGGGFRADHSWAVTHPDDSAQPAARDSVTSWSIDESENGWRIAATDLLITVQRDPCRIAFQTPAGELLCADEPARGMMWHGGAVACWKTLHPHDHCFGLGERGMPLDKRGQVVVNWNTDDFGHGPWSDPLYQSHPFVLVNRRPPMTVDDAAARDPAGEAAGVSYGLFFDNSHRAWFDLGKTARDAFGFGADGGELNYYFIVGPSAGKVVSRYARLVGATPPPPMWALGYQQCRWSYESDKRIRALAREFRRRRIPCDTLYLDIDYMEGYRCFTWNSRTFRKPAALMQSLARDGFKVVTILDPGIKVDPGYPAYESGLEGGHFCRDADGRHYVGKVWPGESLFPDFTRPATRQWWGEQYRALTEPGVRGFWNDMNEPADFSHPDKTIPLSVRFDGDGRPTDHREAHNVYGMQMARATFEGMRRIRPDERPFVLTRAGYSGVQRYAAVWTGDNNSRWDHLAMSIPMMLNLGLCGVAFCGADIGGFSGVATAELYTRWLQLGIFYPLCRTHTAGGPEQDPWSYGKVHEKINKRAIELRYRLLPYLYTEMHHSAATGEPVMRPLLLDFPSHPNVHAAQFEFMFGRQLLIAPVIQPGSSQRAVELPIGDWYRFDPDGRDACRAIVGSHIPELIAGIATGRMLPAETKIPVTMDTIPMFARAGAVIPMRNSQLHADEEPLTELILEAFPGDGGGSFHNDDGISYGYRRGEFARETYAQAASPRERTLTWTEFAGEERFRPATYLIRFRGVAQAPAQVALNGVALDNTRTAAAFAKRKGVWFFDKPAQTVLVRVERPPANAAVCLHAKTSKRNKN